MGHAIWSSKEKKIAGQAFKKAYEKESAEIISQVKEMANKAKEPEHIWELHDYLTKKRNDIDDKYDYRYSQLIFVFGRLLREAWLEESDLEGLDEDKIKQIKKFLLLGKFG